MNKSSIFVPSCEKPSGMEVSGRLVGIDSMVTSLGGQSRSGSVPRRVSQPLASEAAGWSVALLNLPPSFLEAPSGDLLFKFGDLDGLRGCVEHGANVPQVLLRAAFPVIFELAHDDVLGRRNGEHLAFHFQLPRPRQSPGVQWISPTQIYVRFETGLMVNDVEVSALFAGYFHRDHLCRRTIELCWREYLGQPGNVPAIQHHDQIHIMGQARLTINDDRHAPADHVGHAQRVQPLCEHEKEVSLGHTRKSGERPDGWLRRSNRGVGRARQPPLVAGRNETAVRPPSIFAPATLFAPRFALRFSWLCTSLYSGPCVASEASTPNRQHNRLVAQMVHKWVHQPLDFNK